MARRQSYSELKRLADEFAADNAALRQRIAELERPPHFVPLKVAAFHAGIKLERLRRWCEVGKVVAELVNHTWLVDEASLADYMRRMGLVVGSHEIQTVEDRT